MGDAKVEGTYNDEWCIRRYGTYCERRGPDGGLADVMGERVLYWELFIVEEPEEDGGVRTKC